MTSSSPPFSTFPETIAQDFTASNLMKLTSALVGQPPNTEHDLFIIKGILRGAGIVAADPEDGYTVLPELPVSQADESSAMSIVSGMSVCAAVMILVSSIRLMARLFRSGLYWGIDDWMLISATVSEPVKLTNEG